MVVKFLTTGHEHNLKFLVTRSDSGGSEWGTRFDFHNEMLEGVILPLKNVSSSLRTSTAAHVLYLPVLNLVRVGTMHAY